VVPLHLARRASDGVERTAGFRHAGHRPDQSQRPPAGLPPHRPLWPGAGGGARSGREDRHHLRLHLHQLLARSDGLDRLVAQPGGDAHRGGQRPDSHSYRAATGPARRVAARPSARFPPGDAAAPGASQRAAAPHRAT
jgi:hypothetical protein